MRADRSWNTIRNGIKTVGTGGAASSFGVVNLLAPRGTTMTRPGKFWHASFTGVQLLVEFGARGAARTVCRI